MTKKLALALGVYVAIALLAWFTLDAQFKVDVRGIQIDTRIGAIVVAFMALLTVRTLLHFWRERDAELKAGSR